MGYIDVPCDIVNGTCDHNRKATIIGLTGQEIFRPQPKVLIKKLWKTSFTWDFFPFSRFVLVSTLVSLCALKIRPLECETIEKWMFSSRKRLP